MRNEVKTVNDVKNLVSDLLEMTIEDVMNYDFVDGYDDIDEVIEVVQERMYEAIDSECIYHADNKQVINALEMDHFGFSEITGERYSSESEMAFDGLLSMSYEFDAEELIKNYKKA